MKITSLRVAVLAGTACAILAVCSTQATAATYVDVRVGAQPPPVVVEHRWASPYHGAVWIGGHNEWNGARWVYVGGYYGYPPHRGAVYYPARYHNGYYRNGYWR